MKTLIAVIIITLGSCLTSAKEIQTNAVNVTNAPKWLKRTRVEKVIRRIQNKLEWSTRRIKAIWHNNNKSFQAAHGLGPLVMAVTKNKASGSEIHMGPRINNKNFDKYFGHEMVHVIIYQKYKGAIPKWLEEGLANHLAHSNKVNYKWLAKKPFPKDVLQLAHPIKGNKNNVHYKYKASQALAEMLEKKCDLENLIRLSVQRKMENYIKTYCEIADINKAFRNWIKKQAT